MINSDIMVMQIMFLEPYKSTFSCRTDKGLAFLQSHSGEGSDEPMKITQMGIMISSTEGGNMQAILSGRCGYIIM
jgi:hypothetical protein